MKRYGVYFWVTENKETFSFSGKLLIEARSLYKARLIALSRIENELGVKPQYVEQLNFYYADTNKLIAMYIDEWLMLHKEK